MRAELKNKKQQSAQRSNRVRSKIRGTAERPRLSVKRSNRYYYVQLIDDVSGKTLAQVSTSESGVKDITDLGAKIAERAKSAGIKKAVLDRGSLAYGGNLAKFAGSAREGGLDF